MSEEEDILDGIEKRLKRRKFKSLQKFNEVHTHRKFSKDEPKLYQYNTIYDIKGNPIAKIDFKSYFKNKIVLNKPVQKHIEIVSSNINEELKFNYTGFNLLSVDEKIDELNKLDKIFYKQNEELIKSIFMHKTINMNGTHKSILNSLLEKMTDFINSYKTLSLNYKCILNAINKSIEIYPYINLTSVSLCIVVCNTEITNKFFYKIYSKIMYNINPKILIDKLYLDTADYRLFQIKEFYKLYELTGDTFVFKILPGCGNKLMHGRLLMYMGKYIDGYLIVKDIKSILRYKLMYEFNKQKCFEELSQDICSYKHNLFYIWIYEQDILDKNDPKNRLKNFEQDILDNLYKECVGKYNNISCKLAHLRYIKNTSCINMYEDCLNEEIFYENYLIKKRKEEQSYKYLSKCKKKLNKKGLSYDLLEQEMCYLENKECKKNNKYFYLWKYKTNKKINKKETDLKDGDSLIIMYIYGYDIRILEIIKNVYNLRNGFYWSRTRNILDFRKRMEESKRIFLLDQNF